MGKLTVKQINALTEPGRYSDGDGTGFHLKIDREGRKYYVLRLTDSTGKRRDVSIGPAGRMSLSAAREKATTLAAEVMDGAPVGGIPDFAHAARLAHAARTEGYRNAKHRAQWLSTLETYAVPIIGSKPINAVTEGDVAKVLAPIWLEIPETARRVLQRMDRVTRWAKSMGHRKDRLDMDMVRDALPKQAKRRSSVRRMKSVPWVDAPEFYAAIDTSAAAPILRLAMRFHILTASRPGNIALAKRGQFDMAQNVWSIPASEMKAGEPHSVPLSPEAATIARTAMAMHNHGLLFTVSGAPMSGDTLRMMMRRMGRTETPHGFRTTFKEWARSNGWADELSELALAHLDDNEVRAAYARDRLIEPRRPMMAAWAAFLAGKPHMPEAP